MAPEQILGKEVDGRTDLYSMGVMLYRAVTGKLPFTAPNDNALVLAIMDHQYIPMSRYRQDLDPEFEAVVDRAMAKDPQDRFPSAQEMLLALMPWAPVGVRDDCLQGLRSAGAEEAAAFLYSALLTSNLLTFQPSNLLWAHQRQRHAAGAAGALDGQRSLLDHPDLWHQSLRVHPGGVHQDQGRGVEHGRG